MSKDEEGRPESGINRRTLIKRGAIVGGLVWVTPVVQSLRTPALAQTAPGPGSGLCDACLASTIGSPAVTTHQEYNASVVCCNCIAANAAFGPVLSVAICALNGSCQPFGPLQSGPC